jgi:hypothetical protein
VLLVDWFIIFIAVPKLLQNFGLVWPRKLPTRLNSALFIDWLGRTLKTENIDESTTFEIEKTLSLQTITDRFSKIGSEPKLENKDIVETFQSFDYLQSRFSNKLNFRSKPKPQFGFP